MPRTVMGKMRTPDNPYLTVEWPESPFGPTTFKVLKAYSLPPDKPLARVMVCAVSPATGSGGDWGDAYWGDVRGTITQRDPIVTDDELPSHLKGGPRVATTLDSLFGG